MKGTQLPVLMKRGRSGQPLRRPNRRVLLSELGSGLNAGKGQVDKNGSQTRAHEVTPHRNSDRTRLELRSRLIVPKPAALRTNQLEGFAALVVDDLPIYRHAIRRILQPVADHIFLADDGLEALEQLRRSKASGLPIDIVLTDMHMPVMDGLELIGRMRLAGDQTPVVVLTTDPSTALKQTVESFPHTAVAIKPVDATQLMTMIATMRAG